MTINSKNNTRHTFSLALIISSLMIIASLFGRTQRIHGQHWPIDANDATFNAVNCSFGELHGGLRFHGAIDIDHAARNPEAQAIRHGQFWYTAGNNPARYSVIRHESVPGSGDYDRASVYMHITPHQPLFANFAAIQTGQEIGTTFADQGHLHLELFERINGVWYAINPLRNDRLAPPDRQWSIVEHRENGQLVGYFGNAPIDEHDPEINQVFLKGIAQPNQADVGSGYAILATNGGLAHFPSQNNSRAARFHFHERRGASTTNIPVYNSQQDRLAVFGNIAPTAHARDIAVNQLLAEAENEGLTVHRLSYLIDESLKYDITFDLLENRMNNNANPPQPQPTQLGDDEDIFHYDYNVLRVYP